MGVAHCGGPGPNGGMPRRPEEPAGQGNIAPRRRGGLCSRAPRARHPGPAAALRLPPRSRHAALAAAGLLGPRASPARSVVLPAAAFPARPPQRRGGGKQSGRRSRPAGRTPARRPVPGPSGGEGAFRPLGFFLPRWLRRPRYRELPPRCPNTSASAASPPLIGRCCRDVMQTPPLGRHGPRPHSAHRYTHVDPELLGCKAGIRGARGSGRARVEVRGARRDAPGGLLAFPESFYLVADPATRLPRSNRGFSVSVKWKVCFCPLEA